MRGRQRQAERWAGREGGRQALRGRHRGRQREAERWAGREAGKALCLFSVLIRDDGVGGWIREWCHSCHCNLPTSHTHAQTHAYTHPPCSVHTVNSDQETVMHGVMQTPQPATPKPARTELEPAIPYHVVLMTDSKTQILSN